MNQMIFFVFIVFIDFIDFIFVTFLIFMIFLIFSWSLLCCQDQVQVSPGQVQAGFRLGPSQLHVNSKSFNIKVYFKSPRDLDLPLPPHNQTISKEESRRQRYVGGGMRM